MKLLITGCNGSVGKRIVRLALNRGYTVTGVDLTTPSTELDQLIPQDKKDSFTYYQIDLSNYDRVLDILQTSECEAVIHLAALRDPKDYKVQTHNRCAYVFFFCPRQLQPQYSNVVLSWNILRGCAEVRGGDSHNHLLSFTHLTKFLYLI
jgi:nucleoside-diphosphate-sugar epimerase